MSWPLILLVGVLTTVWLRWRHINRRMLALAKKFPGPPPLPLLGNALHFMCKPEELINVVKDLITQYGEVLRFWLGPDLNFVVSNPDDLKALLMNPKTNFKGPQYKYLADFIGGGILSGSGPVWRKHRKIASPNYSKRAIEGYTDIFNTEVDYLLQRLRKMQGRTINVYDEVVKATTYTVCQTLMGLSRKETLELPRLQTILEETPRFYHLCFLRMTKWYLQIDPIYWFTSNYKEQERFVKNMLEFSNSIVEHRNDKIKDLKGKVDVDITEDGPNSSELSVIDRFLLSEELNKYEMATETFTVFTSSQEATAKMASYLLLMMAYHPKCQEKLYAEIKSVIGDEDRCVTDDELKQMPYLEMVYKEILRLFPIGAMIQRSIHEDIQISSGTLPAGCSLVIPIYHMHRDPRFWSDPDAFDPERFSPENTKLRHPNCYIPFSLGPMDCLGRYFGTKLVKTLCVRVLSEFELTSKDSYKDLKLFIAISAASLNGFKLELKRRK